MTALIINAYLAVCMYVLFACKPAADYYAAAQKEASRLGHECSPLWTFKAAVFVCVFFWPLLLVAWVFVSAGKRLLG